MYNLEAFGFFFILLLKWLLTITIKTSSSSAVRIKNQNRLHWTWVCPHQLLSRLFLLSFFSPLNSTQTFVPNGTSWFYNGSIKCFDPLFKVCDCANIQQTGFVTDYKTGFHTDDLYLGDELTWVGCRGGGGTLLKVIIQVTAEVVTTYIFWETVISPFVLPLAPSPTFLLCKSPDFSSFTSLQCSIAAVTTDSSFLLKRITKSFVAIAFIY